MARARVLVVGSELLGGRADADGPLVGRELRARGLTVTGQELLPDEEGAIARAVRASLAEAELTIVTGGLGPTSDDVTREGVAAAVGRELRPDGPSLERLRERAEAAGRGLSEPVARQALTPADAEVVENRAGTAPGWILAVGDRVLVALPGPPSELAPMLAPALDRAERLLAERGHAPAARPATVELRVTGLAESRAAELLGGVPLVTAGVVTVASLAAPGDLRLTLAAEDPAALEEAAAQVRARLGDRVYSDDGSTLAEVVIRLLCERSETVGTIESCTGGLLAAALTDVPGSSAAFRSGLVTYADEAKVALAGVAPAVLTEHGAVSEEVVRLMAAGGRHAVEADWTLAVSGIAGPGGGTPDKPVGLVHVAACRPDGTVTTRRFQLPGDRAAVRQRSVAAALDLLRRELVG